MNSVTAVKDQESKQHQPSTKDDWIDINGYQHINFLDDVSFDNFVKTKNKVLIMFYSNSKYSYILDYLLNRFFLILNFFFQTIACGK